LSEKSIPLCHACKKRPAVTYKQLDGRYLCVQCFSRWVIKTVKRTIKEGEFFKRDDRIVVGLSGGKDSTVLLHALNIIEKDFPSELIAICIDEGIAGYRDDALPIAEATAKKLDIEFKLFSFKELFRYSLDELVSRSRELQKTLPASGETKIVHHLPCSFCGVFRRKALNIAAREVDGDIITTGHNLNDVSQTILLNLLRGDANRFLLQKAAPPKAIHPLLIPRVKPLQTVAERDVVLYAFYNQLEYHTTECPYAVEAMRLDVRNFLSKMEHQYPGTLHCIRNAKNTIVEQLHLNQFATDKELQLCQQCGEPASAPLCRGCRMLNHLFPDS
jgi:uncharacterized protein (TIGR00269 family)